MIKMECSNVVGNEISSMQKCLNLFSQLSDEEIKTLIDFLRKEQDQRENKIRVEKIKNAINAINDLSFFYDYLDIDGNEVFLSDIILNLEENLC